MVLPWTTGGYLMLLDWVGGPTQTLSPAPALVVSIAVLLALIAGGVVEHRRHARGAGQRAADSVEPSS